MSIVSKYNRIAPIYELIDLPFEVFFFRKWRSTLKPKKEGIGSQSGDWKKSEVLFISCSVTGIDYSEKTLEKTSKKARGMTNVTLFLMDAKCLGFQDNNFDYVVTTFTLCSIPNPLKALKEMRRFLKPSGELIDIEYVQSSNHFIAWLEDLINPITCSLI